MTTSGTIDRTKISVSTLLDKSFAKARIKSQQIGGEMLENARDDLDMYLKTITETGVKLWSYEPVVVKMRNGRQHADLPEGTSDVDNVVLRKFSYAAPTAINIGSTSLLPLLGDVGYSSGLYQPITFFTQAIEGDYELHLSFLDSVSRKLTISYSVDGATYSPTTPLVSSVDLNARVYAAREYYVFPLTLPFGTVAFRIEDANGLAMNILDLMLVRGGQETQLTPWGEDQIARTGNTFRGGNPTNYFVRRHVDKTLLMLWPVPDASTEDSYDLVVWRKRHLMDLGRMTNTLDIPSRWIEAIVWQLAWRIAQREPEAQAPWSEVKAIADEIEMKMRETERVQGPIKLNFRRR